MTLCQLPQLFWGSQKAIFQKRCILMKTRENKHHILQQKEHWHRTRLVAFHIMQGTWWRKSAWPLHTVHRFTPMNCKPFQIEKLDWQRKPPCGAFFITRLAFYQSSTKSTNQRHKTEATCLCKTDWICFINRPPFHTAQLRRFMGRGT